MKEIILAVVASGLGIAALGSAFMWAAFDVSWWQPIDRASLRDLVLGLIHIFSMVGGALGMSYLFWRFSETNDAD